MRMHTSAKKQNIGNNLDVLIVSTTYYLFGFIPVYTSSYCHGVVPITD